MTQEHSVKVEYIPYAPEVDGSAKHRWVCSCGASGNLHSDSKTAWTFGSEHLEISRPYVRESEA